MTPNAVRFRRVSLAWALIVLSLVAPFGVGWGATVEVYYGPDDAPLDRLTALYRHATRYLYVAAYGLTSPRAVEAMVAAKKRGVDVRLITELIVSAPRMSNNARPSTHCIWLVSRSS